MAAFTTLDGQDMHDINAPWVREINNAIAERLGVYGELISGLGVSPTPPIAYPRPIFQAPSEHGAAYQTPGDRQQGAHNQGYTSAFGWLAAVMAWMVTTDGEFLNFAASNYVWSDPSAAGSVQDGNLHDRPFNFRRGDYLDGWLDTIPMYTKERLYAAAGINTEGFIRVTEWDGTWPLNPAQIAGYGLPQAGDIVGPWHIKEVQSLIIALKHSRRPFGNLVFGDPSIAISGVQQNGFYEATGSPGETAESLISASKASFPVVETTIYKQRLATYYYSINNLGYAGSVDGQFTYPQESVASLPRFDEVIYNLEASVAMNYAIFTPTPMYSNNNNDYYDIDIDNLLGTTAWDTTNKSSQGPGRWYYHTTWDLRRSTIFYTGAGTIADPYTQTARDRGFVPTTSGAGDDNIIETTNGVVAERFIPDPPDQAHPNSPLQRLDAKLTALGQRALLTTGSTDAIRDPTTGGLNVFASYVTHGVGIFMWKFTNDALSPDLV